VLFSTYFLLLKVVNYTNPVINYRMVSSCMLRFQTSVFPIHYSRDPPTVDYQAPRLPYGSK